MEVVVFGSGSLGSLVGGLLARAHDVTLVGRDPHMRAVQESGLRVTGVEGFVVHPDATTRGDHLTADLAVVTVKSFDTADAAAALATADIGAVISLQNGMGNEDTLAGHLACPVLAGSITYGALLREPGVVEWTGRGDLVLGGWAPPETPVIDRIARAFDDAGLEPRVERDMRAQLWSKLAVNAAINPVTALARVENGALRSGRAAHLAHRAAHETAAVARADGVDLADSAAVERVDTVVGATADNRSSMLEDISSGSRTEIDQINGHVVARADDHGIEVPVNRALTDLVQTWEDGQDLR